jgi:hypothetical protein
MPVPSTMIGLTLTVVLIARARVASALAFIITGGPIATTSSMSSWRASASRMPSVIRPRMPAVPSFVHRISSSQTRRNLSSQKTSFLVRNPSTAMT